jgi:hypothetical protein
VRPARIVPNPPCKPAKLSRLERTLPALSSSLVRLSIWKMAFRPGVSSFLPRIPMREELSTSS